MADMSAKVLLAPVVTAAMIAVVGAAEAQEMAGRSCDGREGGVVAGVVTYEDPDHSSRGRGVYLMRAGEVFCSGATRGGDDRFLFTDVPPGRYRVHLASLGVYPPDPLPVEVSAEDTVHVEIVARPEDALDECRVRSPSCAETLDVDPPAELPASQTRAFLYWRAALALAGAGTRSSGNWLACLDPFPDERLRQALTQIHPDIVPAAECRLGELPTGAMTHVPTGRPARVVRIQRIETVDGPILRISYHLTRLHGAWLRCPLSDDPSGVTIGRCETTMVS